MRFCVPTMGGSLVSSMRNLPPSFLPYFELNKDFIKRNFTNFT